MVGSNTILRSALQHANITGTADEFWTMKIAPGRRLTELYVRYRAEAPVSPMVVFYEVMSGARVGDNPFAMFEYLRAHAEYGTYLHVWALDASAEIPRKYVDVEDVVFVRKGTQAYGYFLATAGWLIGNANLPQFFTRRSEQRYLNTWHGVPYKALGRNTPGAKFGAPSSTGSFIKATHVLTQCRFMSDAVLSAYSMSGASTAVIAETGYPRVDVTVAPDPERAAELRETLGIGSSGGGVGKPVVLYAPTWRAEAGQDVVDTDQLLYDLGALASLDIHVLYRGHHRMDRIISDLVVAGRAGRIIIPPHDISSNELLTVVDVLITDYSSIFFDFVPTGRPIVHYLYDLNEYARTRGLNLEVDELPGEVAHSTSELLSIIEANGKALRALAPDRNLAVEPLQGERYRRAQLRFSPREDGKSSKRAVEFFFRGNTSEVDTLAARDGRRTVVFWAGSPESKAQVEPFLKRVISSGRSPRSQTTLVIGRNVPVTGPRRDQIRALRKEISTIAFNVTEPVLVPEERAAYEAFLSGPRITLRSARRLLRKDEVLRGVFLREYQRRLDDAQFDSVVLAPYLSKVEIAMAVFADRSESLSASPAKRGVRTLFAALRSAINAHLYRSSARRKGE